MNKDSFLISDENRRRLVIDLLVRITAENQSFKQILIGALSGGDETRAALMYSDYKSRYTKEYERIKGVIFGEYGSIDLSDFFGDDPK